MLSHKIRISLLFATHVVCGPLLAWLAPTGFSDVGLLGLFTLVEADAGLLAIWAGLSAGRLGWRLVALVFVMVYLEVADSFIGALAASSVNIDWTFDWFHFSMLPVELFGVLSALRLTRRKLHLVHLKNLTPSPKDNQFSIQQLLVATAVVAGVLGIDRAVRSVATGGSYLWVAVTDPLCTTETQLATLWAALGSGRPALRLSVVLPVAFIMGYSGFELGFFTYETRFGLQAIITAASLLVIRSCGWRLVWGNGGKADRTIDAGVAGEQHRTT